MGNNLDKKKSRIEGNNLDKKKSHIKGTNRDKEKSHIMGTNLDKNSRGEVAHLMVGTLKDSRVRCWGGSIVNFINCLH